MSRTTVPRRASTTIIIRDQGGALQVLMLRRSQSASFMPGAYVFPGGAVDAGDASPEWGSRCDESRAALATRLGLDDDAALGHAVAALRECFEECGLWLGCDEADARALAAARQRLHAGASGMAAISVELGLPLATSALQPWSHWVTPIDAPKRFDTRFFVALAPPGQQPTVDECETITLVWVNPADALAQHAKAELPLEFATRCTLASLLPFDSAAALMRYARYARAPREMATVHPRVARTAGGERRVLLPQDAAYAEVMRVDPEGTGSARCTLDAGVATQLASTVWRTTAPNPGMMTGPGTNSYLVGRDGEFVVIDPGPAIEVHIEALLTAGRGRLRAVLVTHTHTDHSPAAERIAARTGVPRIGLAPPLHGRQDRGFAPERQPGDGERFELAGCVLQAIHTPGHASNHVCWWLEEERMLFTGDHVMQGSTVVIDPPDGDMAAYLASLAALPQRLPLLECLAPGHGFLIDRPHFAIERLLQHRRTRETKVTAALRANGASALPALVVAVYADVPEQRHAVAQRSLLAHLLKLRDEGVVAESAGVWRLNVD